MIAGLIVAEPSHAQEAAIHPVALSPSYSWGGTYIGVQAGYGWGRSNYSVTPIVLTQPAVPMDMSSGSVGSYAGYNVQSGALVAGIEGDFSKAWLRSDPVLNPGNGITTTSEIDWSASVRARVGYAFGNLLPYIAGGVTFAGVNFPFFSAGDTSLHDNTQTRVGWTSGVGLEYALSGNLSVRGEYRYTDLGERFEVMPFGTSVHPSNASITLQEVRAGVTVKFGDAPPSSIDTAISFVDAPPAVWSGLYAGALASFVQGHSNYVGLASLTAHVPLDSSATIPWLYAGYNFQWGRIVLGVEGDIQLSKLRGDGALVDLHGVVHPEFQVTSQMSNAWSVRGRLGFAFGNFLPYVTAGVAGADYEHAIEFLGQYHPFDERFTSWTAGAGLEYALSDHLILRGEYRHTPYGQATHSEGVRNTVDLRTDEVRIGAALKL